MHIHLVQRDEVWHIFRRRASSERIRQDKKGQQEAKFKAVHPFMLRAFPPQYRQGNGRKVVWHELKMCRVNKRNG